MDWAFKKEPDALCLQEVKARPDQLDETLTSRLKMPYHWNPAVRAGYSGVATFFKTEPDEFKTGMDDAEFDAEGRIIQTRWGKLRLVNAYFPSGQRGHDRVDYKLRFYARLLEICQSFHSKGESVVITGDFNTAHMPIDLKNPKGNSKTSGFLPEEREWVQRYLDNGFVDAYRRLYPDRVQYTWWTYRLDARARGIGWRLDYFLVSEALMPRIKDVIIHDGVMGSDHCPVELVLRRESASHTHADGAC